MVNEQPSLITGGGDGVGVGLVVGYIGVVYTFVVELQVFTYSLYLYPGY